MKEGESPIGHQLKNWEPLLRGLLITLNHLLKLLRVASLPKGSSSYYNPERRLKR